MNWTQRFAAAAHRSVHEERPPFGSVHWPFTWDDYKAAKEWNTCAVGENAPELGFKFTAMFAEPTSPFQARMWGLGARFPTLVYRGKLVEAMACYNEIASEIKAYLKRRKKGPNFFAA